MLADATSQAICFLAGVRTPAGAHPAFAKKSSHGLERFVTPPTVLRHALVPTVRTPSDAVIAVCRQMQWEGSARRNGGALASPCEEMRWESSSWTAREFAAIRCTIRESAPRFSRMAYWGTGPRKN